MAFSNLAPASVAAEKRALQAAHLRLDAVVKRFDAVTAVDHVTLEIPPGAFATLLGPSGCGKTTLLRLIAGFYEPDAGAIYLDNARIDHLPAHKRGTAMVFQDYALFPHLRVYDNVAYGLRLAGLPKAQIAQRVAETLQFSISQGWSSAGQTNCRVGSSSASHWRVLWWSVPRCCCWTSR